MRAGALGCLIVALAATAALAKDASPDSVKGLYLATDLPALTIRAGEQAPLPFAESLALIWPQATGLIAGRIGLFAVAYVAFQRQEARA